VSPPYTAVVLAGGRGARLGGVLKPQLEVGGRTMLAAVLEATADAAARVVVGPPQPVPPEVVLVREQPPGGGPVAALRAGLEAVGTDVVAALAGDLPFLTAELVGQLRERLTGDGVLVVDDTGQDQLLLGLWRTEALRAALAGQPPRTPLRRVLAPLAVRRLRPVLPPGRPAPWTDCDTPAELARARAQAGERPQPGRAAAPDQRQGAQRPAFEDPFAG
jgi:molybdopterin-guanine dinucleotide biosynthesis protein A